MIQCIGIVKKTELARLKRMEFVVSAKEDCDDGYRVTLVRLVNPWDGILGHLREEFPRLVFTQIET